MGRKIDLRLMAAFLRPASMLAALRCFAVCRQPLRLLYYYITKNAFASDFIKFRFRTPTGDLELTAFSPEDVITFFIIFCRREYTPQKHARVFVDFGSNIGVTAAYFLSRDDRNVVYCYEPNSISAERLKANLKPFEGRYFLEEVCVGDGEKSVTFGIEPTGVYSAVGLAGEGVKTVQVPCRDVNDILSGIISERSRVDFLKIDIEGLEKEVIRAVRPELLKNIGQIEAETGEFDHQIPGYDRSQCGSIVRYQRAG